MTRRSRAAVLAAWLPLVLAGCTTEGSPAPADTPELDTSTTAGSRFTTYVALGDSFTAGPYVPVTDLASGCFRSSGNYPALVAQRLGIPEITDVSCSGAKTRDLVEPQHTMQDTAVPPQLDALPEDTDLVTLGIGGNDFELFSTLVGRCSQVRSLDPSASPCTDVLEADGLDLVATARRIGGRVARAIRLVQERAPEAKLILVGYLRLAPTEGHCPRLGFARGDYDTGNQVTRALNDALADAARATGVDFVDMYSASEGHDVCADEPWVNGRTTDQRAAFAYHPLPAGMDAVADRIVARLR